MKKQNVYAAGLWGAALSLALLAGAFGCNNGAAPTYTPPPKTGALNDPAKRRPVVPGESLAHPIEVIEFRKGLTQYNNSIPALSYDTTVATNTVAGLTEAANANPSSTLTAAPTSFSISLGAFGGSISYAYDHSIPNTEGTDLKIAGNAFAGNSEPGAVFVSQDVNGNGIADDPWYPLISPELSPNVDVFYNATATFKQKPANAGLENDFKAATAAFTDDDWDAYYAAYKTGVSNSASLRAKAIEAAYYDADYPPADTDGLESKSPEDFKALFTAATLAPALSDKAKLSFHLAHPAAGLLDPDDVVRFTYRNVVTTTGAGGYTAVFTSSWSNTAAKWPAYLCGGVDNFTMTGLMVVPNAGAGTTTIPGIQLASFVDSVVGASEFDISWARAPDGSELSEPLQWVDFVKIQTASCADMGTGENSTETSPAYDLSLL
ncbi:hypothetical protein [Treponema endosymbiont of Eucomonympha sp.]|uniref:hypothetical protein n=1 Tax=Treponema endosymbiont of Eucomonympha sp. TaxID=1580831 RepID=UPI000AB462A3|nr:hypothetical protein [Treponema endosymbiont of Eucomonympha sp.]